MAVVSIHEVWPSVIRPLWAAEPPEKETLVSASQLASPPVVKVSAVLSTACPSEEVWAAPAWVTVNCPPATVMVPVREVVLVLAATE